MDSSELYHVKQQFLLGAYKTLIELSLPDPNSPDYTSTLVYKARSHIALGNPSAVATIIPKDAENVALKTVTALARYVAATESDKDEALEALRDLAVEIEGDDVEGDERDKETARVLVGTAFAQAGEVEEALETLGAGGKSENLEAVAYIIQIYLSISRPDLAKAQFEQAKRWAEDDLLLQLIESSIGLATGRDAYNDAHSFFNEQLANPSLSSSHLLTARGVTRVLRGTIDDARSDLEESLQQQGGNGDAETVAAFAVAAGLGTKRAEAEEWWTRLVEQYPKHPLVADVAAKSAAFDQSALQFVVPPLAVSA